MRTQFEVYKYHKSCKIQLASSFYETGLKVVELDWKFVLMKKNYITSDTSHRVNWPLFNIYFETIQTHAHWFALLRKTINPTYPKRRQTCCFPSQCRLDNTPKKCHLCGIYCLYQDPINIGHFDPRRKACNPWRQPTLRTFSQLQLCYPTWFRRWNQRVSLGDYQHR